MKNEKISIRADLVQDTGMDIVAIGFFAVMVAGVVTPGEAYRWYKNTSSNQFKSAIRELVGKGYASEADGQIIFHNEPTAP